MLARATDKLGSRLTVFLSPDKQIFSSRERIAEYLTNTGDEIVSTNGYRLKLFLYSGWEED